MKHDQNKPQLSLIPEAFADALDVYRFVSPLSPNVRLYQNAYKCKRRVARKPMDAYLDAMWLQQGGQFNACTAALDTAAVLAFGAKKYAAWNWLTVEPERYVAAFTRHMSQHFSGQPFDSDSGLPHLSHAACSAMFVWAMSVGVTAPLGAQ